MTVKGQRFDFEVDDMEGMDTGDEAPVSAPSSPEAVVHDLYAPEGPSDEKMDGVWERMKAVENRLALAQYYRLILNDSLFKDQSEAARQVDQEIREFVCGRLEVLMGEKPEVKKGSFQDTFTDMEVKALKTLAGLALARAQKAGEIEVAPPSLNKVEAQAVVKPAINKVPAPVQPRLPAPKPQVQKPKQPEAQPRKAPPPPPAHPSKVNGTKNDPRIPVQYRDDPTLVHKNGQFFVQSRDADGVPLWEIDPRTKKTIPFLKNITLPAKPAPGSAQPVPMPTMGIREGGLTSPFSGVMAQHGEVMLGLAEKKTGGMGIGNVFAGTVLRQMSNQEDGEP